MEKLYTLWMKDTIKTIFFQKEICIRPTRLRYYFCSGNNRIKKDFYQNLV